MRNSSPKRSKRVGVDPTQRVQLLDRRRVRAEHAGPAHRDLLAERLHDRGQQLVLRADQPVNRAGAELRRRSDVPDGRDFITLAAELGSGDGTDMRRFVVGFFVAVFGPRLHDRVGCDESRRPVELVIGGWDGRPAPQAGSGTAARPVCRHWRYTG